MLQKGGMASLADENGKVYTVMLSGDMSRVDRAGLMDTSRIIGREFGDVLEINERKYTIVKPNLNDLFSNIRRKAQIITLKDAGVILARTGIKSGDIVVEAGAGSGAMTICLCHAVHPSGRVITYEEREDFARIARKNVENSGYGAVSTIKVGDAADMVEQGVSAVVMDIPEPWRVIEPAWKTLMPGGSLAAYVPTVNQAERTVLELRKFGFQHVLCTETIERELEVGPGGSRPSFNSPGHTGYVITARRMGS